MYRFPRAVTVDAVERTLESQLDALCMGSPLTDEMTVESVVKEILVNQGCVVEGQEVHIYACICTYGHTYIHSIA
jgi:Na+-translocating ferredoxin:NAD+ oxidoreductase RnfE subunit